MKRNKDLGYIKSIIKDQPADYQEKKDTAIAYINSYTGDPWQGLLMNWLTSFITGLPFQDSWNRSHIYLLVHDLMNEYIDRNESIYDLVYEIESGIIGECSAASITNYPGEPENTDDLAMFVRDYKWL